jgi:hypothetical protein
MLLGNIIKRRVVTMVEMGMLCVVAKRVRSVWWQQQAVDVDFDAFVRKKYAPCEDLRKGKRKAKEKRQPFFVYAHTR